MWPRKRYFVYILASHRKALYTGVTSHLFGRVMKHREDSDSAFVSKYKCHRLVYYAVYETPREAIATEKKIKGWRREKKIALIESVNPDWNDLIVELDGITD